MNFPIIIFQVLRLLKQKKFVLHSQAELISKGDARLINYKNIKIIINIFLRCI